MSNLPNKLEILRLARGRDTSTNTEAISYYILHVRPQLVEILMKYYKSSTGVQFYVAKLGHRGLDSTVYPVIEVEGKHYTPALLQHIADQLKIAGYTPVSDFVNSCGYEPTSAIWRPWYLKNTKTLPFDYNPTETFYHYK